MRFEIFQSDSRYGVWGHYTKLVLFTGSTREEANAFLRGVACGFTIK